MKLDVTKLDQWQIPEEWLRIKTLDAHTGGEPLRIILEGYPDLPGDTILLKRRYATAHYEDIRKALMWEPRGHADMYGCILTPPVTSEADYGVLFIHNEGFSTMCGHAVIALSKVLIETGIYPAQEPLTTIKIDAPPGLITSYAQVENNRVTNVFFRSVPAFVLAQDRSVDVPGLGNIRYDIAFGGAFYAFVHAQDAGVELKPKCYGELIQKGMAIKHAVMASEDIRHPVEADLGFLYGTIFTGPAEDEQHHSRNVCIFADGEVDRSPTGSGVSARMALHHARNEINEKEPVIIESILGTTMTASVHDTLSWEGYDAVIPEVGGTAYITGINEFLVDPEDPLKRGFFFR
ncbi:MAG: proline racemase [Desulfobacteraceae bacterium]|nr:MAG: proline racemase [Desulfobacteraceae bacterium]